MGSPRSGATVHLRTPVLGERIKPALVEMQPHCTLPAKNAECKFNLRSQFQRYILARMGAQVIAFPRKQMLLKREVSRDEFFALVDKTRDLARQLKNINTKQVIDLLTEMKFSACFNNKFRNKTYPELEELYNDLLRRLCK
jgi:hypothetical protein